MVVNINNILYTAVVTPMLSNGEIDYDGFENLLLQQTQAGNGILLLGSTGEALALSESEQRQVVAFASKFALSVPLLVGVGGYQLSQQLAWLDYCYTQNIDGFLMVTPLYAKPGPIGQIAWFKQLLDYAKKPCMLYNVPSRTGVNLAYEVLEALHKHPNFWALKEASGDLARFKTYHQIAPNIQMYSGEDDMMAELAKVGAKGLVSVVANLWPNEARHYVEQSRAHKMSSKDKRLWKEAAKSCFSVANPIPSKAWLAHQGIISTANLRAPLVAEELTSLQLLENANQNVQAWFEIQKNKQSIGETA